MTTDITIDTLALRRCKFSMIGFIVLFVKKGILLSARRRDVRMLAARMRVVRKIENHFPLAI